MNTSSLSRLCRLFSLVLAASALMACAADASQGDDGVPSPAPVLWQEAPAAYQQRVDARPMHGPASAAPAAEQAIGDRLAPASPCAGGVETKCDGRGTCWCPTTQLPIP